MSFLRCNPDELRTLFLFEALSSEQLKWLCERGHVESFEPGFVTHEGEPAEKFFVLMDGEVAISRKVGDDDIEINRTSQRGVYGGAFSAYLGDRVPQTYNNSLRAYRPSTFFVLSS